MDDSNQIRMVKNFPDWILLNLRISGFFMFGMQYTAAGDASLMITFNPLFTAILAVIFLSEKMHLNLIIGLMMGMTGVGILFYYSPNVDIPIADRILGNILIAGAALAWACNTIFMKQAMTTKTSDSAKPLNPLELTVWSSAAGLIILTPITALEAATRELYCQLLMDGLELSS